MKKVFGKLPSGETAHLYTITSGIITAAITDFGSNLVSLWVPDKDGNLADVTLGFDSMEGYIKDHGCMGETIGRYGNRIGKGTFTLDGVTYQLATNNGNNHLHGGNIGFGARMWEVKTIEGADMDSLAFHRVSPDGEENYPGTLDVTVTYSWDDDCNLTIRYEATTDKATHCNLTNHTYFNLAGHDHGTVRDHIVWIDADVVTAVDSALIPTGGYMPVVGTPLDMRDGKLIGEGIDEMDSCVPMQYAGGYDHNFVLRKGSAMAMCACVFHEESGRLMEVITDQPGVQLYTACTTDYEGGRNGMHYQPFCGLCLETQHYPDTPNHSNFPTTVLRPGEKYDTTTIYAFRVEE